MPVIENDIKKGLSKLFNQYFHLFPEKTDKLPVSGSGRIYFRLQNNNAIAIGVFNNNLNENKAFINFTEQFAKHRIHVPEVYADDLKNNIYLISDLGGLQLLEWVTSQEQFNDEILTLYKKIIQELIRIQVVMGKNFDFSMCYPFIDFNKDSILYDLNYFKTKFIDSAGIRYGDQALYKDFNLFSEYLLSTDTRFFMFRDFQARNILIKDNQPYFIDYQGGRKGALQYDLASLLFQAKAQIPEDAKLYLLNYYIQVLKLFIPVNTNEFTEFYYAYALIRVLQTFGAYGLRGIIEKKKHFIESIPFAINNLIYLKDKIEVLKKLPELNKIISVITGTDFKAGIEKKLNNNIGNPL